MMRGHMPVTLENSRVCSEAPFVAVARPVKAQPCVRGVSSEWRSKPVAKPMQKPTDQPTGHRIAPATLPNILTVVAITPSGRRINSESSVI